MACSYQLFLHSDGWELQMCSQLIHVCLLIHVCSLAFTNTCMLVWRIEQLAYGIV